MQPRTLTVGDVVQISPETHKGCFKGCFMTVTEPNEFGALGLICVPGVRIEKPNVAFAQIEWADMEYIGRSEWTADPGVRTRLELCWPND